MNDSAWERLVDALDVKAGLSNHRKETKPLEDRPDLSEQVESFEFELEGSNWKIQRRTGPAVVDRKSHYTHRPGTANRIENIYDPSEASHRVTLFRQVGGDWQEQDISSLAL